MSALYWQCEDSGVIRIREIDHLVIRVGDAAKMLDFYCRVLGCTVERRQDELGLIQLRAGRSLIDFITVTGQLGAEGAAAPAGEGRNMDHFCLRVDPFDAPAISHELESAGVTPGAVASRYGAEGEGPSLYFADPEGNTIELKGPPDSPLATQLSIATCRDR
jgi:glyoxylase I family protein